MVGILKEKLAELFFEMKVLFSKKSFESKVFCIGYNKTGTTTLGKSLEILGYKNSSFNKKVWRKYYKKGNIEKVIGYTSKFESFDDLPWLKVDMIPILDKKFPGSKFIYLEREEDSWKKSYLNWTFKRTGKFPDPEKGWESYCKHREFVRGYFENRPEDIIILDVKNEYAFRDLGKFLGRKAPQDKLPHFNKT